MFLIDDLLLLPVKGFFGIFKKIHEMAEQELSDENHIRERLMELQLRFELNEIGEEEYNQQEKEPLGTFRRRKRRSGRGKRGGVKMAKIEEAGKISSEFLKRTLDVKDVKVIKVAKVGDGWEAEAEVYEESSFIKSLGLPTRMQDRNIYSIKLDENLEVQSYERKS